MSLTLDLVPVIGDGKNFIELLLGKDLLTGEEVSRVVLLCTLIIPTDLDKVILDGVKHGDDVAKIVRRCTDADKKTVREILNKTIGKANPEKVVKVLEGFTTKTWTYSGFTYKLDKDGMQHILERHHPDYWNGTVATQQSFLDASMSIDDIVNKIDQIIKKITI